MPLKRDLSKGEKANVGKDEVIISPRKVENLCCRSLRRCFCLRWPFGGNVTQSCSGMEGRSEGTAPGCRCWEDEHGGYIPKKERKKKHPRRHVHSYMNTHAFFHLHSGTHAGTRTSDEGQGVGIASHGIYFKNLLMVESTFAEFPPYWRKSATSKVLFPIENPTVCFYCSWLEGKEWGGACRTGPGGGDILTQRLMGCSSLP